MVERIPLQCELPKLATWVRFPPTALTLTLTLTMAQRAYLEQLLTSLRPELAAYVHHCIYNWDDAEDVLQTVLCKVWERRATIRESEEASAYIFTAARREVLTYIQRRRVFAELRECADYTKDTKEIEEAVSLAMRQLREPYRQTIHWRYFEGRSSREIGEFLHIPANTAKTRIYRARQLLAASPALRPFGANNRHRNARIRIYNK